MPFVRHLGKTNMITHIPQDIKLELKNSVLTLKAGSKVYVPNGKNTDGSNKFDVVVTSEDKNWFVSTTAGTRIAFYTGGSLGGVVNTYMYSGDTTKMNSTTAYTYARFYNTETNKIYVGDSNGGSWVVADGNSLPVGIFVNDSTGKVTEVSQIFNGFGYIGSVIFLLPNVRALVPNGRNADGSLKNIEWVSNTLLVRDQSAWGTNKGGKLVWSNRFASLFSFQNIERFTSNTFSHQHKYNEQENQWYFSTDSGVTWLDEQFVIFSDDMDITSGVITKIVPKKVGEGYVENKLYQLAAVKDGRLVSYSPIVRGKRTYYKQDLKQRDTGTYTFTLDKDYTAKMLFVGNGGGGGSSQNDSKWRNTSGGSGACFQGKVRLPKGTYTLTIGTLGYGQNSNNTANMTLGQDSTDSFLKDSSGKELIRVGCGARGIVIGTGGAGGVLKLGTLEVLETIKAVNGNQGDAFGPNGGSGKQVFALSAYDGTTTGYGAGTSSHRTGGVQYTVYGVAGIFDLALETDINNYTYYEDVGTKIY